MPSLLAAATNLPSPVADWPDWLVLAVAALVISIVIWILVKFLKLAFWLACVLALVVAILIGLEWLSKFLR